MSRGGEQALIVLGLVVLGLVMGIAVSLLGIEAPWTYVIMGVVVVVVVPPIIRYRSRPRS
ncbi:hypothetical protein SAMN04488564_102670 [Lentzea waywayandensis]|uniref:Uncharacterized protein n=1 Tax=Lentzea waywayandensis TaxID=84724 RepID=A0A1I6DHS3_9PSEU|nr:hypothetical protein [Lentzea waywayandensis]SFR05020.1 hypothetical protein SAMN04488564_102670 [Lentzea waywayandensis]